MVTFAGVVKLAPVFGLVIATVGDPFTVIVLAALVVSAPRLSVALAVRV